MNNRTKVRRRVLKGATIIQSISTSEISCVLCNQSEEGAEFKLPADAVVPNGFQLYVPVDRHRLSVRGSMAP